MILFPITPLQFEKCCRLAAVQDGETMNVIEETLTVEDCMKQAAARAEDGDYVGAIQSYDRAILLDPNFARAYGNRGLVRANLGDGRGAIQDWQQAAKLFLAQGRVANYEMVLGYIRRLEHQ